MAPSRKVEVLPKKKGMRNRALFTITFISVLSFWQYAWFSFKHYYSGIEEAKQEIKSLQEELVLQAELNSLYQFKFSEFKQEVASVLVDYSPDKSLPFSTENKGRELASVLSVSVPEKAISGLVEERINRAADAFDEGNYALAIELSDGIVKDSPVSSNLIRAYFILAESLYQTRKFSESLEVTNKMMELFPEHDLTGFSMLRVGQILLTRQRQKDAAFTFRLVADTFEHPNLKKNAKFFLSEIKERDLE